MSTVTLQTLRTRVRERADMVGSSFVADSATGIDAWINEANQKLHGMVVDALGEQYVSSSAAFTTVTNQTDYTLPTDFYKLYGVDLFINGFWRSLLPLNNAERNAYRNAKSNGWFRRASGWFMPRYQLVGNKLRMYPEPDGGMSGTFLYAPEATVLTLTTDSVTYPNGWERFIVLDAAIQALLKEESSPSGLIAERDRVVQEIQLAKENRDLGNPQQVVDTAMIDSKYWW